MDAEDQTGHQHCERCEDHEVPRSAEDDRSPSWSGMLAGLRDDVDVFE
jgi:hypothetical protein